MRSFAKKLACVLATGSMVVTMFPAAKAQAADDLLPGTAPMTTAVLGSANSEFALNRTSQILYVNEGASYNKQTYDFNFSKAPAGYLKDYGFAWATDKPEVATVQAGGVVTAVGVGKAKISCAVTKKGTTDVVATVTADVEVKANAKTVTVTNAAEYEGKAYEAGDVVDLNRSMTDYAGNQTNVRGKYVTDLTRWVAEPATGVEINQANGQFTFTEEADGEYDLFCETYQSAAHPEATAKSNSVKVTVNKQAALSVKQNTVKNFTVVLGKSFKSLTVADVTVNRLFETADATYKYPQVVKAVTLAADGKSAEVEVFSALANNEKYEVKITGSDPVAFKASAGKPATMTLSASADKVGDPFIAVNTEDQQIYARLYDANGVDVTTEAMQSSIIYEPKTYAEDGSYYVAGNTVWFAKEGLSVVVVAEYMSGEFDENGNAIGNVKTEAEFFAVEPTATAFAGMVKGFAFTQSDLYNNFDYYLKAEMVTSEEEMMNVLLEAFKERGKTTITLSDAGEESAILGAIVKDSTGKEWLLGTGFGTSEIPGIGTFSFEEVTPNVAALDKDEDDFYVVPYQTGNATFILNLTTADGKTMPVGSVTIEVLPARVPAKIVLEKSQMTLSYAPDFSSEVIGVHLYDQYGDLVDISECELDYESLDPKQSWLGDCCEFGCMFDNPKKGFLQVLAERIESFTEGKDGKYTFNFCLTKDGVTAKTPLTVLVKKPDMSSSKGDSVVVEIDETSEKTTWNGEIFYSKKNMMDYIMNFNFEDYEKFVEDFLRYSYYVTPYIQFNCYVMNNGVKKDYLYVEKYPSDVTTAREDQYYYKVLYNGKDITDLTSDSGRMNVLTAYDDTGVLVQPFNEADLANFDENDYLDELYENDYCDFSKVGGGTYTLVLYKGIAVNGKVQLVQQKQASKTLTCTPSSYQFAGRTAEYIDAVDLYEENFLKCLSFKDDIGTLINAETWKERLYSQYEYDPYFDYVVASDYVHVNYAVFYANLFGNSYDIIPYKVPVNVTLKINK